MNAKRFEKWRTIRLKGKLHFSLTGILYCGVPLLIVSLASNWPKNSLELLGTIAIYALAGLVLGRAIWFIFEREYQRELAQRAKSGS
ncbi:hypothetical protein K0504_03560 [Neiella marina]|uniref:Uncharacterized protein n=1 Tax=Neiella holothuriorum TaxID=2870530 RepID=A0ABS7EEI9_9GAMM|nr:hypothetical protein [Neiella holothuriorum]MBW8190102.1 hypothetical protein [Neiella holothuriorum]